MSGQKIIHGLQEAVNYVRLEQEIIRARRLYESTVNGGVIAPAEIAHIIAFLECLQIELGRKRT